ncbi:hypothetical protein FRB94_001066 [Tulasnella sp. JGI-2019a]|nr:hypothetical protein FRB94_001066 [Tulasnella sp. JGI-2019a]KAG9021436.1 hypothetical protein FRB95_002130 [Tulasnella sp. JGI-2019a]
MNAILREWKTLAGNYYTVNPQAVKEDLDVFAGNHCIIQYLTHYNMSKLNKPSTELTFVTVRALLIGSIVFTQDPGSIISKGDDMGWFQYSGSTTVLIAPKGTVQFDANLVKNSLNRMEMLIQVGECIGALL